MNKINSILAQIEKHFTEQRSKSLFSALYTIGKDDNKHGTYNVFDLLKNEICPIDNSEVKLVDKLFFEILSPILSYLKNDLSWLCVYYLDEVNDTHNYCIFFPQDTQELHQFCSIYDFANTDTYYSELNNSSSLLFESKENTYLRTKILYFKLSNTDDVNNYQDDENLSSPIWIPIDIFKKYLNDNNDSTSISIETCIQNADVLYSKLEQDSVLIKSILMNPFYQDACLSNALDVDIEVKKIVRYMYWLSLLNNIIPFKNYYYFPANLHGKTKVGGYVLATKNNLSEEELCVFQSCANRVFSILAVLYTHHLKKITIQKSLKSAVSAIMTRNMSHNLGSHYLHYTKTQLENLAKKGGGFGPDIRGAARVMGYMQGRMDYLATLISMDRYPYGCVNFKSQIFDELTIDDFSKRHFEKDIISNDEVRNVIVLLKRLQREDNKREIVKANLESLYKLSKKALTNKSHNRTTNFLLTNLILSENFTRPSILDDNSSSNSDLKMINLQVLLDLKDEDEESYTKIFTGTLAKKDDEEIVKRKLSKVNIALPGGVMSSHAFFNIVENFIRNSAKYLQTDFSKSGNLTITIKITEIDGYYEFTLFDDKQNANKKQPDTNKSLLDNLLDKISNLRILDDNKALDKKDKGFKEMLFSALWLRSYMYQNISDNDLPQSYEEVLVKMESVDEENTEKRLKLIKDYGFELLAVDDNGNESKEDNANLALRLSLPKFCPKTMMGLSDNALQVNLSNLLHIYADVAMIDAEQYTSFVKQLNEKRRTDEKDIYEEDMIIPRLLKHKKGLSNVEALNEVLHNRFGNDFDNYQITSGTSTDNLSTVLADNKKIYFQRHLSTQDVIDHYKGYAYADSVSGGNYTITLFDIYERWAKEGRDPKSEDYYQIIKIKESALTRITIIDERFFKKMKEQHLETELACKNIRVLNYYDSMSKETEMTKLLEGNEFNNHENHTHFLSIHLGIIEKIIKNVDMFKKMENSNKKVKVFMKMLKEYFGPKVFISIHSGRGNFSAELEDALDMYPFISMAALENAYENSKYLLAQLFYSTIYIGKGVANHDN